MVIYATALVTKEIGDCLEAAKYINEVSYQGENKRVPMVLVPSRMPCSLFVCVPEGFKAFVASHGKHLDIWEPGFHFAPPWYSITHMIGLQNYVYDTPVKECPTLDNVMVTIDVTIVFHVRPNDDTLMKFAFTLGPEGLDGMLEQVQQDSVRAMVRQRKYAEVYDLMNAAHDEALVGTMKELNNSFADYGVEITAMAVTNVHLPMGIQDNMQQTTIYDNQIEYNKLHQQHQLLVIENEEKEKKERQAMKEKLEQYEAECKKRLAAEHAKLGLIKAETKKILAEIREQENADTLKIEADSKLQVSTIDREKEVQLSEIRARGQAEGEQLRVEARAHVLQTLAAADASVAKLKGEATTVIASAENSAVKGLASKRKFDQKMRQLNVIQGLSQNTDVSISGTSKDNYVAQLLASGRNAAIMGVNDV